MLSVKDKLPRQRAHGAVTEVSPSKGGGGGLTGDMLSEKGFTRHIGMLENITLDK